MKKIGLMTFHTAFNCGAMLQAIATQLALNKIGFDCTIIDYYPNSVEEENRQYSFNVCNFRFFIKGLLMPFFPHTKRRTARFEKFRNKMNLTKRYKDINELMEDLPLFDIYMVGSDQVWNTQAALSSVYFLDFVPDEKRKVTYASSFGTSTIDKKYNNEVRRLLNRFDQIAVRESFGQKIIVDLLGKKVPVVLDPTFLLSKNEWEKFEKKEFDYEREFPNGYLFYYGSLEIEGTEQLLNKLATIYKVPIVLSYSGMYSKIKVNKKVYDVGPQEFLSLIKNATLVFSNSFHATAFSIIYQKEFYVIPHPTRNSRMESLLDILGLSARFVTNETVEERISAIDYVPVNARLQSEINKSYKYLQMVML